MTEDEIKNHPLRLMTMPEVAAILRISTRTLRDHIARGEIRYVAVGGGRGRPRKLFTEGDVQDFIRKQTRQMFPVVRNARDARRRASPLEPPPVPKPRVRKVLERKPTDKPQIPRSQRKWRTGEPLAPDKEAYWTPESVR